MTRDDIEPAPKTVRNVFDSECRNTWLHAMDSKVAGLEGSNTWSVVESLSEDEKAVHQHECFGGKLIGSAI